MKKNLFLIIFLIATTAIFSCKEKSDNNVQMPIPGLPDSLNQLFSEAGVIKIYDPLLYLIGESDSINSYEEISLFDVAKFHGKVCPGIATGFFMFQDVLSKLYPDGKTPIQGQIAVAVSNPNDMMDLAGYILGIRNFYGRGELGAKMLQLDTSLQTHKKMQFVMIFKRIDNGKMLKVTFNKYKIFDNQKDWSFIKKCLEEFKDGKLKGKKLKKFQKMVLTKTTNVLKNHLKYYTIDTCKNYKFPSENCLK
jgi:formylmethanofuran dehydrogenase subunit E